MNRHYEKRITRVSKPGRSTVSAVWRIVPGFETLERRDLLDGDWTGCVVETGADGQHVITGSCPAQESGERHSSTSGGDPSYGTGNEESSTGADESSSDSSLSSDFFNDPLATGDSDSGDCSAPLPDGTYPHYCLHNGQMVYTGEYQDNDVDVDGHCAEPLADGTTPHSCFHDGQIVYPGEYQDSNEYGSDESLSDEGRTENQSFPDPEDNSDDSNTDFSGQFVGVASEGIGFQDGPGFGSTSPPGDDTEDWPNPWYNEKTPTDTNGDGKTSPHDALLLVNELNSNGSRQLTAPSRAAREGEGESASTRFLDANKDRWLSPADVLAVINQLNSVRSPATQGEGEAIAASGVISNGEITAPLSPPTQPRATATEHSPSSELDQSVIPEPNDGRQFNATIGQSTEQVAAMAWEEISRTTSFHSELDESLLSVLASESRRYD